MINTKKISLILIILIIGLILAILGIVFFGNFKKEKGAEEKISQPSIISFFNKPKNIAFNKLNGRLYVLNSDDVLMAINSENNQIENRISFPLLNNTLFLNSQNNTIYLISQANDLVIKIKEERDESGRWKFSTSTAIKVSNQPTLLAINEKTNKIFVINMGSKDLSIINGDKDTVLANIPLGGMPLNLAVNEDNNKVYIADRANNEIIIVDGLTNKISKRVPVGNYPFSIIFNEKLKRVYVANRTSDTISVIDSEKEEVIKEIKTGREPVELIRNSLTNKLYVANALSQELYIIDEDNYQIKSVKLGTNSFPERMAIDEERNKLFVSSDASDLVTIHNEEGEILKTFDVKRQTSQVIFNTFNSKVYINSPELNGIFVINSQDDSLSSVPPELLKIDIPPKKISFPYPLFYDDENEKLFVVNRGLGDIMLFNGFDYSFLGKLEEVGLGISNLFWIPERQYLLLVSEVFNYLTVVKINNNNLQVIKKINIGERPRDIIRTIRDDGKIFIYVANSKSNNISVIDIDKLEVVRTISVGQNPSHITIVGGNKLYISEQKEATIRIIDLNENDRVLKTIKFEPFIGKLSFDRENRLLFGLETKKKNLFVINARTDEIERKVNLEKEPFGLDYNERSGKIYINNYYDGTVTVVDTKNNYQIKLVKVGNDPVLLRINKDFNKIYVLNKDDATVSVINGQTDEVEATLRTETRPFWVTFNKRGDFFIANVLSHSISIFNKNNEPVATIKQDGTVVWAPGKGPVVERGVIEKAWQRVIGHPKTVGAILAGIILVIFGWVFWQKRLKKSEIKL